MTREEFAKALRRETDGVRVGPALMQRTLDAAKGKEVHMKKKISFAVAFALIAVTLCAVAIAAANRWGMLDFVSRYSTGPYIPEDAQSYVQRNVASLENDWVTVNVRELYYDGRTSRMTVDVTPKEKNVLLVGEDVCLSDPFVNLTQSYVEGGENDMRPIAQVIADEGYEKVYMANVHLISSESNPHEGMASGMMDYILGEDGTLTIFSQEEYITDMPTRDVIFCATIAPLDEPLTADSFFDYEKRLTLETPVTLTAAVNPTDAPATGDAIANVYVNEHPVEYPDVGVRVDRLLIEVKPQEIYATLTYTVTDRAAFDKLDDGLWFEFIDPDKTLAPGEEGMYAQQRLTPGLTGGGMVQPVDSNAENPTVYRQTETLGKNELRDTYTLRAFDCWEKGRFDAHTFDMRPATAADLAEEMEENLEP